MTSMTQAYQRFEQALNRCGLNLLASFTIQNLPEKVLSALPVDLKGTYKTLLLVGNKGGQFWQYLRNNNQAHGHCFDQRGKDITVETLSRFYPQSQFKVVYPGADCMLPLQQLGHQAGWGRPSVLGLDIHPDYGTWFAYRVAVLVSESLPASARLDVDLVCEQCADKPCQAACPASAVKGLGDFNLAACVSQRVSEHSQCADKCLARLACPVGRQYSYSIGQLAHHSHFSLNSIKRYLHGKKW